MRNTSKYRFRNDSGMTFNIAKVKKKNPPLCLPFSLSITYGGPICAMEEVRDKWALVFPLPFPTLTACALLPTVLPFLFFSFLSFPKILALPYKLS